MKLERENIEAVYPLSPMQAGMVFHSNYQPGSGVYVEQLTGVLYGDLNVGAFLFAWQQVVDQTPVLRTSFAWKRLDKMLQVVHRRVDLPVQEADWSNFSLRECEERLRHFLADDRRQGFDLTTPPLVRLALFRLPGGARRFVWTFHHAILDGWSHPMLLRDVFSWYKATLQGIPPRIIPRRPYQEYITWLQAQDRTAAEKFWREQLRTVSVPTPLIIDEPRRNRQSEETASDKESLVLSADFSAALLSLAQDHRVTLNALIQSAWAIVLSRYSGEHTVVFGVVVSGRPTELTGVESMIGLFINTLPVRVHLEPGIVAMELVRDLHNHQFDLRRFEYTPLVDVHGASAVPRDTPLFESIVVFENYPHDESLFSALEGVEAGEVRSYEQTNYPLTVVASFRECLTLEIAYAKGRFRRETIRRVLGHISEVLQQITAFPRISLGRLKLPTEEEERVVMAGSVGRTTEVPEGGMGVPEWFDRQAEASPYAAAIVSNTTALTYKELRERAESLARVLRRHGVGPEKIVGLYCPRSEYMVIGMLGVWKAGGAFVPLDPTYPEARLRWMLADSGVHIVVTIAERIADHVLNGHTVLPIDAGPEEAEGGDDDAPAAAVGLENLAYIIYTSGSTGEPKGVFVEHRGLSNLVAHERMDWEIGPGSRVLQSAPFSFDAAVSEILLALLTGGALFIPPYDTLVSAPALQEYLREHRVSQMTVPPALLAVLNDEGLTALRTVVSAADVCPPHLAHRWSRGRKFFNGYGPTEATVGSCWHQFAPGADLDSPVPIGRPIGNVRMYVLDDFLNLLPTGIPGELYIGGVGVARGYVRRPEITAAAFLPDPFCADAGARMFRTGDRGRLLPDGNFEFLGRLDHQVKIRGYRIETGEVEHALRTYPLVSQAIVLARTSGEGEKRLVAYVVSSSPKEVLRPQELRDHLAASLPEFMIPSAIVIVDAFPLTPNGKIDRDALPDPRSPHASASAPPRQLATETERILAGIVERILGVQHVGPTDSFFELGGHSLRATQVLTRLREAFAIDLPLRTVFEYPTVEALARIVDEARARGTHHQSLPPLTRISREQDLPLSFAQQRLWFLSELIPDDTSYVVPIVLRISGPLDVPALREAFATLISRHEVLRTIFPSKGGIPYQQIVESVDVELRVVKSKNEADEVIAAMIRAELSTPFSLSSGPLFRLLLVDKGGQEHILVCTVHHIVADGWSAGILVQELSSLYEAHLNKTSHTLASLRIQYADYAWWQREWLTGESLELERLHWKNALEGAPSAIELPTDLPRNATHTSRGSAESLYVESDLLEAVRQQCRLESVSPFMLTLSAFFVLLHKYSGQDDIVVGSPVANRHSSEVEHLIGFFVNTLPVRARVFPAMTVREVLAQVRRVCLTALDHQQFPFEKLVEELQPTRDLGRSPIFQVAFVFQEESPRVFHLPGVTVTPIQPETTSAKYDLTLALLPDSQGIQLVLEYNADLFQGSTISRMLRHYRKILEAIVGDAEQRVADISMLDDAEYRLVVGEWCQSVQRDLPRHRLARWFEEVAESHAEVVAVESPTETATYQELNRRVNQLAHYLRRQGVGPEVPVGIFLGRSVEMIVALWATLKAGGAFVPLDPSYPVDRLQCMMADAEVTILLSTRDIAEKLALHATHILLLDEAAGEIALGPETNPDAQGDIHSSAYMLYTSGTTGSPKGIVVEQQSVINLVEALAPAFAPAEAKRILQFSSLSFDVAVQDVMMTHLSGGTLVVVSQEALLTGQAIWQTLHDWTINSLAIPASVLAAVPAEPLPELETIVVGGEKCRPEVVERWAKGRRFYNAYGPTETTVCVAMYPVTQEWLQGLPIGRPLLNTRMYILDSHLRPVPIGVPGELFIGGIPLARGYHKRADATAEKFIPDPFGSVPGSRLYRTGDLVRFLSDGTIEFLRRIDTQVKLRGFRVELGEVEVALGQHPSVREAVAILREDTPGDRRLVAYVVGIPGLTPVVPELREHLRRRLPEHMVPSTIVVLEAFPLTPNGKLNRDALPAPDKLRPDLRTAFVAPRTATEKTLAELCATVLNLDRVGVFDHFFDLGGHSLLATQLIARAQESFRVEVPLRDLFENPTVASLAERIDALLQRPHTDLKEIAKVLGEVTALSDQDVDDLLGEQEE